MSATEITPKTKLSEVLETRACGRCGGSGRYGPYSVMGGRCFGCNGQGYKFTKRGERVRNYFLALSQTDARYVQVGERIWTDPVVAGSQTFYRGGWATVEANNDGKLDVVTKRGERSVGITGMVRVAEVDTWVARIKSALSLQAELTQQGKLKKVSYLN